MKTTITIVDPFKGTLVVETEGNAEVRVDGNSTSVVVDGKPVKPKTEPPTPEEYTKAWNEEAKHHLHVPQIRTPAPEQQTMKVTTGEGEELPQKEAPNDAPVAPVRGETPKNDPEPSPEAETPAKQPKKAPVAHVHVEKTCQNCGDPFTASGTGSGKRKFCDNCKSIPSYKRKGAGRPEFQSPEPKGANGEQPEGRWWCIYHKSWQPHRSPECPIIDEQKSPAERAAAATEAAGVGEAFTDPWNCGRCREDRHLCRLHRSMEASGTKPPKIRPS